MELDLQGGHAVTGSPAAVPAWCPLAFDVDRSALRQSAETIRSLGWMAQATAGVQQRIRRRSSLDWSVVPLLAPNGDPERTDPGLPGEEYGRTPMLDALPALDAVLDALPCEKLAARLMKLVPHAHVVPHIDRFFGLHYGKVRLHLPLITSEAALMVFGDRKVHWSADHLWYGDFASTHTVTNEGGEGRVHLVVDCIMSSMLYELFPRTHRVDHVMLSRSAWVPSPPAPLQPGIWRMTVCRRALDWTQSEMPALERPIRSALIVADGGTAVTLRMPSGFYARLLPIGDGCYRVGRMPEEIVIQLKDGGAEIVRRVGRSRTHYVCSLIPPGRGTFEASGGELKAGASGTR